MEKITKKVLASILAVAIIFGCVSWQNPAGVRAMDDATFVKELTLEDSDTATETKKVYDLLTDPDTGITMDEGDTYTFEMDIYQTVSNAKNGMLMSNMFAFDLLKRSDETSKPAGIEFSGNNVLYWISNGAWNAHVNNAQKQLVVWIPATYHYTFTVKAYKSIRVEILNSGGTTAYDGTIAWDKVYGLSACTKDSDTVFKPNLVFTDQVGSVKNINVQYTGKTSDVDCVKKIELTDTDATNTETKAVYPLLAKPEGITMNEGDAYTFEMDICANVSTSGSYLDQNMIAFDLLGNCDITPKQNQVKVPGIKFLNNQVLYWVYNQSWEGFVDDSQRTLYLESKKTYHYRFTVIAYENIQVEVIDGGTVKYDGTVAWDEIYGLNACTKDSNTVFKPNLVFTDQVGTVKNINVQYTGKKSTVNCIEDVNLEDTDTATTGTKAVYNLLVGSNTGITMSEGDTYTFEMDFYPTQLTGEAGQLGARMFAFDLLKKDNATSYPAGIYFKDNAVLYWIETWSNAFANVEATSFTIWKGTTYHYTFTVKAYDSIQVEVLSEKGNLIYTGTAPWNKVYGLKNCTEDSNTVFTPNVIFTDQDGTLTNVKCTYTRENPAPAMGEEDKSLTEGKTLLTTFAGTSDSALELGEIATTIGDTTWYYSGTFSYDTLAEAYGGLKITFGEGSYIGETKDLTVAARIHQVNDTVIDTKTELATSVNGATSDMLYRIASSDKYGVKTTDANTGDTTNVYTYTVKVSNNKVSFWIDDTLLVKDFDLTEEGVTNIVPKFAINADGTTGTISDIKVWGDVVSAVACDANGDGVADIRDLVRVKRYIKDNGVRIFTGADVVKNGKIAIDDLNALRSKLLEQ